MICSFFKYNLDILRNSILVCLGTQAIEIHSKKIDILFLAFYIFSFALGVQSRLVFRRMQ